MTGNEFLIKVNEPHAKSFCQRSARSGLACASGANQLNHSYGSLKTATDSRRLKNKKIANNGSINGISNHVSLCAV